MTAGSHKEKEEHMSSTFVQPSAPSSGIKWEEVKGALLLIEPLSLESQIQTTFGPADAVKANVAVIDGPGAGDFYADCLVFPKLLSSQLRGSIGQKVLGRLTQGTAKPGQSAPWLLDAATTEDQAKGETWIAERSKSTVTSAQVPF